MSKNFKSKSKKRGKGGSGYRDVRSGNSRPLGTNKNNSSWYMLTPELGRLVTAVNMLTPNGLDVGFADGVNLPVATGAITREPGVAANIISMTPGGVSDNPLSAVNEGARTMFTWIRKQLLKNITRYGKADLFIHNIAVANIMAFYEFLKLPLRILSKFELLNKYTPLTILRAMRIDTEDLTSYAIEMETYLKLLGHRLETFIVPNIPMYEEIRYTFSHIYLDEDIAKAQYIVNVPAYLLKFTRTDEGKGKLVKKYYWRDNGLYTVEELKGIMEELIAPLANDEDYAFMSGDIMAAYPNHLKIDKEVNVDPVEFEYSKEFLEKWHNSCQLGINPNDENKLKNWEYTVETSEEYEDYIVFDPTLVADSDARFILWKRGCGNRYIDFYDRTVTPEQVMNATRWMFNLVVSDEAARKLKFYTLPSQIVNVVKILYFDNEGVEQIESYTGAQEYKPVANGYLQTKYDILREGLIRKWNYSPLTVVLFNESQVQTINNGFFMLKGDLGNYTVVERRILKGINTEANYTTCGVTPLLQGK